MRIVKRSLRKNKIKDKNIQELWSSSDVGPSRHLSEVILVSLAVGSVLIKFSIIRAVW
jgi:hypothetical protein